MSGTAGPASLVQLLKTDPTKQTQSQSAKEAALLEDVAVQYSSTYEFVGAGSPTAKAFGELFDALVRHRLLSAPWRSALRPDHLLRVLQCCRLLSRDNALRQRLVEMGGVQVIAQLFREQAAEHFRGTITAFQIEVLTECASIIKRLAGDEWGLAALTQCEVHVTLVQLLNSTDPAVLPLVLVALIGFAAHRQHYAHVTGPAALETLLRIVQQYDLPFKRLAADLLALLARREAVVAELLALSGLGRIVGQLAPGGDGPLAQSLLRVVCYLAADAGAVAEMYHVGSIPVLMSLVGAAVREVAANPSSSALPPGRATELQLAATALTRLAEHDECSAQIRACNGVTLLGKLLLVAPAKGDDPRANEKAGREVLSLKAYVFRALRYLFSVERNRKMFKRLFPPDLFAAFIDVGHYNAQLPAYAHLVTHLEDLSDKQRSGISAALDDVSADREGSGLRCVGGYVILEMLGKGAFGAVYKARKSRGELLVALKELPLSDIGLFGATDQEVSAGVGRMCKEVEILSSLSHPNIVQYYESFASGPYLYIAMELVEGTSLLDFLQGLEQKGRRMSEADIWQVLIAVTLALNYIHGVKKIVHRDLTPANIVLGQGAEGLRHTKIADFGLAKRLSSSVVAQSMVGTMPYTCPEIIQQEPYTEKADVWSLGCVTYHMLMLRPPFDGTNPLSVAHKIVEGAYDPPADPPPASGAPPYSEQLKRLVGAMMTVDPHKRPGISEVGALVSNQLMAALERAALNEQRVLKALQMERTTLQQHRRLGSAGDPTALNLGLGLGTGTGVGLAAGSPLRAIACRKASAGAHGPEAGANGAAAAAAAAAGVTLLSTGSPRIADAAAHAGLLERMDSLGAAGGSEVPTPAHSAGGAAGGAGAAGGVPGTPGPGSALRTVTLATSRLKPVSDPLTQMLTQLHKVMWVEQLPPGLARDHRRRAVESFRRHLFAQGSNAASVKLHLAKLQAGHGDLVADVAGRPIDFGSVPLAPGEGDATATAAAAGGSGPGGPGGSGGAASTGVTAVAGLSSDGHLTYEQLSGVLESLLAEKGYYGGGGVAVVPEAELLDQLPLPNFNATQHVGHHGGVAGGGAGAGDKGGGFVGLPPLGRGRG